MSHTQREQDKLLQRVRRIAGQVGAVERALQNGADCAQVLHLIAGCRGAMNGLLVEVIEDHVRSHLVDPDADPAAPNADAAGQLIDVVRRYFK
jgi:DNA-binding FrmR family transcriptional regulator